MTAQRLRLLKRAALWLLLLGPFFYLTYGLANWWASTLEQVPSVVFDWEHHVPFLAWTIFPYWSLNLFYGGSILLGRSAHAIDRHALRLLTAQVIATGCFVLWPLHFSFAQPAPDGPPGLLFDALRGFDKPYNQAPSLHIALAIILWDWCRHLLRATWAKALLLAWMLLICVSVLTTRQHHFIDIPTGALLGLLCVWLWPLAPRASMRQAWRPTRDGQRLRLASFYGLGAALCLALGLSLGGSGLWLCWPAASLALVALNYGDLGARGFAMNSRGRMHWAARWLFAPYRLGAAINAWCWTRRLPIAGEVLPGIWLARLPRAAEWRRAGQPHVVSLCAELQAPRPARLRGLVRGLPLLDLVTPTPGQLRHAASIIEGQYRRAHVGEPTVVQPIWVCCALGFSRSAACLMAWLLLTGRAASVDEAEDLLRAARPAVVVSPAVRQALSVLLLEHRSFSFPHWGKAGIGAGNMGPSTTPAPAQPSRPHPNPPPAGEGGAPPCA